MDSEVIAEKVREFLRPHLHGHVLQDNDDIFALGYVNSLFAMQLLMFVEKDFGIALDAEDLEFDNFRSVRAMTALVQAKTAVAES